MKNLFALGLVFLTTISFAQDKMITKTGKITFEASVPSFEEVKASKVIVPVLVIILSCEKTKTEANSMVMSIIFFMVLL